MRKNAAQVLIVLVLLLCKNNQYARIDQTSTLFSEWGAFGRYLKFHRERDENPILNLKDLREVEIHPGTSKPRCLLHDFADVMQLPKLERLTVYGLTRGRQGTNMMTAIRPASSSIRLFTVLEHSTICYAIREISTFPPSLEHFSVQQRLYCARWQCIGRPRSVMRVPRL
jgi:hypothetical protein